MLIVLHTIQPFKRRFLCSFIRLDHGFKRQCAFLLLPPFFKSGVIVGLRLAFGLTRKSWSRYHLCRLFLPFGNVIFLRPTCPLSPDVPTAPLWMDIAKGASGCYNGTKFPSTNRPKGRYSSVSALGCLLSSTGPLFFLRIQQGRHSTVLRTP